MQKYTMNGNELSAIIDMKNQVKIISLCFNNTNQYIRKISMDEIKKYEDIINMEHPTSKRHPRMDAINRAAQFAPFKALTGLEDEIEDTATQKAEDVANLIQREMDGDYMEYLHRENSGFTESE